VVGDKHKLSVVQEYDRGPTFQKQSSTVMHGTPSRGNYHDIPVSKKTTLSQKRCMRKLKLPWNNNRVCHHHMAAR